MCALKKLFGALFKESMCSFVPYLLLRVRSLLFSVTGNLVDSFLHYFLLASVLHFVIHALLHRSFLKT